MSYKKMSMSKRLYKKRYKKVIAQIADKCHLAFKNKAEKKAWISEVTNKRMDDMKRGATPQ